jgi:hypothetical protein
MGRRIVSRCPIDKNFTTCLTRERFVFLPDLFGFGTAYVHGNYRVPNLRYSFYLTVGSKTSSWQTEPAEEESLLGKVLI